MVYAALGIQNRFLMLLSFKQLYFDNFKMLFYDECSIFSQIVKIDFDPLYPM